MKVGSLVELVDDNWDVCVYLKTWLIELPVRNKVYTVRDISNIPAYNYKTSILLDELFAGVHPIWETEEAFLITRFRELQPPIANIEQHINSNTLEKELV